MNTHSEYDLNKSFSEYLDEVHPLIEVFGYKFEASRALRKLDPIAYREMYLNWLDVNNFEEEI